MLGIRNGWGGLIDGLVEPLTEFSVTGILPKGGTILGTSRRNPAKTVELIQRCRANFQKFGLEGIIAIGGEDTLGAAAKLHEEGLPMVGIPKTIDNDLTGTEYNIGFDTAINIVVEAIDRLHSTAESHHRAIVVEVMGRRSGWIAAAAGLAGGADVILVPEHPYDIDQVCEILRSRREKGKTFSIVVVAEGARPKGTGEVVTQDSSVDEFGHVRLGGVGTIVAQQIRERLGIETRVTILGHIQRGGTPTAEDRFVATRLGLRAVDLAHEGRFGRMVAIVGGKISDIPLSEAAGRMRTLDPEVWEDCCVFFR